MVNLKIWLLWQIFVRKGRRFVLVKKINVTQSSMPKFEDYIEEIKSLWESHWLTNNGEKHQKLEKKLTEYLEAEAVTLFTNGHLALETIIETFNLTGEVITTPFTFVSTSNAIVRNGLTPVFCDIDPKDYTIDVKKIEALITSKTTAIIPVHVYGNLCNMKAIDEIARKYNLKVIYDAAHAFGVKINGKPVSHYGDASMFSFHATKVFNTIEGGAVIHKKELKENLEKLKNFGISSPESVDFIGSNSKMNEFQASMGLCNLKELEKEIGKRKKVVDRYFENLSEVKGIKLNKISEDVKSNYAYFPIRFENYKMTRDEVHDLLLKNNIVSRKYFYPIVPELSSYKNKFKAETPIAKRISEEILTLPLYADLDLNDVDKICKIIKEGI